MPDITAKITNDDGTELSFGPMSVSKSVAKSVSSTLEPLEAKRQEELLTARIAEIEADQERRSKEAEEQNQRRIKASIKGIDPDRNDD